MRYRFLDEHRHQWPVRLMCQVLQVCPGGYYSWRDRPARVQQQRREALTGEIQAIHQEVKERDGSPRLHAELVARGQSCCVNTVAKLMRQHGIAAKTKRKFRGTTDSNHDLPVADNILDRQFEPTAANPVWVADLTSIPTGEGWRYLAAVEELYSRQIVGWSMGERITSRLVVDAVEMAVSRRLPGEGLLAHSERGRPYARAPSQRVRERHGIPGSMSRRGDCWDNAPMESFFASLKTELVPQEDYRSGAEARARVFAYIEVFCNRVRRHSALGYLSPVEYEQAA
jgi:putative transposase